MPRRNRARGVDTWRRHFNPYREAQVSTPENAKECRQMASKYPPREDIGHDQPLRLAVAAALAFPDGSMTASGLRREAARGRLAIERIAGKDYTTLANIERMRELCRVEAKELACGSNQRSATQAVSSAVTRPGSSATERVRFARAALEKTARGLSGHLPSTSPANTEPRAIETVIRLTSSSSTS